MGRTCLTRTPELLTNSAPTIRIVARYRFGWRALTPRADSSMVTVPPIARHVSSCLSASDWMAAARLRGPASTAHSAFPMSSTRTRANSWTSNGGLVGGSCVETVVSELSVATTINSLRTTSYKSHLSVHVCLSLAGTHADT